MEAPSGLKRDMDISSMCPPIAGFCPFPWTGHNLAEKVETVVTDAPSGLLRTRNAADGVLGLVFPGLKHCSEPCVHQMSPVVDGSYQQVRSIRTAADAK